MSTVSQTPTVDELLRIAADNLKGEFERIRKSMPHHAAPAEQEEATFCQS